MRGVLVMILFETDRKRKKQAKIGSQIYRDSRANAHFIKPTILSLTNITLLVTMKLFSVSEFVRKHQYDVREH